MDPVLIVFVAILLAICLRVFWKEILEVGIVLLLAAIFVGVLTVAAAAQGALRS